jgi:hypothetical protein
MAAPEDILYKLQHGVQAEEIEPLSGQSTLKISHFQSHGDLVLRDNTYRFIWRLTRIIFA